METEIKREFVLGKDQQSIRKSNSLIETNKINFDYFFKDQGDSPLEALANKNPELEEIK